MEKQKLNKNNKGITLIALIITIIVMLILVGVSVTVALDGGLFTTAQKATGDTEAERDKELALSEGKVEIGESEYNTIEEYINKDKDTNPPSDSDEIEDELAGTWVFSDFDAGNFMCQYVNDDSVNFTSNGQEFDSISTMASLDYETDQGYATMSYGLKDSTSSIDVYDSRTRLG